MYDQNSHDDLVLTLTLPTTLSDEAAYCFCEFFYGMAASIEGHYAAQLKRHWKKVEGAISSDNELVEQLSFEDVDF